jgi:hypothetical protein
VGRVEGGPAGPAGKGPAGAPGKGPGGIAPVKNKVKYQCPVCRANVWGKPGLALACLVDEVAFVELAA